MSLLKVDNLSVRFHTRNGVINAVDSVSFAIEPGQTLGIVGESGSGKSVCCYSLLGLVPMPPGRIESGSAWFDGEELLHMPESDLRQIRGNRISMIFQDPMTSLNPYMRIGPQLIEPLLTHKNISRRQAKAAAIDMLAEVGIQNPGQRYNDYPHQFSGGMRQRVMIAMALITEPELLIADEPTTALDVTIQAQILELIGNLQQSRKLAVIFISHDLGVIAGIADQVAVMHEGRIVEYGSSDSIFYRHQHPYTAKLLASIPTGAKRVASQTTAAGNPLLRISNVSTNFPIYTGVFINRVSDYVQAVSDVSLKIGTGEILGLVGESGSGKSTLARNIMRLINVDTGTITFDECDISELNPRRLKQIRPGFQMIFQDPYASLNPRMTIYDALAEPLLAHRMVDKSALMQRIYTLMDDVGLARRYLRKYPHEFSGGQRQRIAIARALALQPKLIVADEPVSALDVTIQAQILQLLLNLSLQHNLTMLFISHDLSVVRYIADRVAVMYQGRVVEMEQTETLFHKPQHPYTQSLLAAIPIADPKREKDRKRALLQPKP